MREIDVRKVLFVGDEPLVAALAQYRDARNTRNAEFIRHLRALGFNCLVAPIGWPNEDMGGQWRSYLDAALRNCARNRMGLIIMCNMVPAPEWFWKRHPDHPRPPMSHPRRRLFPPPNCPDLRNEFARWMTALHNYVNSHPCGEWAIGYTALIGGEGDIDWELQRFHTWEGNPEFEQAWREWLLRRYGSLAALHRAWRTKFGTVGEIGVPKRSTKRFEFSPRWLDYVRFCDAYGLEQAEWQAALMKRLSPDKLVMIRWSWPLAWLSVNPWLLAKMPHIDIVQCKDASYRDEAVGNVGGVCGRWRMNMACELSVARSSGKIVLPELDIAQRERGKPIPFPSSDDVVRDMPLWANYSGGLMFYALKKVTPENEKGIARAIRRARSIIATTHEPPKAAFLYSMLNVQCAKRNPAEAGKMPWTASVEFSLRAGMQFVSDALAGRNPPCPPPTPRVGMVSEHSMGALMPYETVVVTGNQEAVSRSVEDALRQFVARGGRLLCFAPFGRLDERGRERPGKCLGFLPCTVTGARSGEMRVALIEGEALGGLPALDFADTRFRSWYVVSPRAGARVLARFADGSPAIVSDETGRIVVFTFDPGPIYCHLLRTGDERARPLHTLIRSVVNRAAQ